MARTSNGTITNYLAHSGGSLISASAPRPLSISVMILESATANLQAIFCNNSSDATGSPRLYFGLNQGSDNQLFLYSGAYAKNGSSLAGSRSTSEWRHAAVTWDSSDNVEFFFQGVSVGTTTRAAGGNTNAGAVLGTLNAVVAGHGFYGALAEFAVWNVVLSAGEMKALGARCSPAIIRPQSLVTYVPMFGNASPEVGRNGTTWTVNGTFSKSDHAPMIYPVGAETTIIT